MRRDSLPSPGRLSMGIALQGVMSKAISAVELAGGIPGNGGKTSLAKQLDNFLVAARTAIAGYIDAAVPTVVSRVVGVVNPADARLPGSIIRVRCNKQMDPMYVPAGTAFTIGGSARTVTKVEVDGPDVLLTVSSAYTSADASITVAYAQPGAATNLRDLSGNLLAAFAASAVTNSIV